MLKLQHITNIMVLRTPALLYICPLPVAPSVAIDKEYIFYTISA